MPGLATAIFTLISNIPAAIKFAEKVHAWLTEQLYVYNLKKASEEMNTAIVVAKTEKDTNNLDAMFDHSVEKKK